jgi:hypothetical protein
MLSCQQNTISESIAVKNERHINIVCLTLFSNLFQEGHYSYLETASTHKNLAIQIATFYLHLQDGIQRSKPTYSVTYVDQFSEVGEC